MNEKTFDINEISKVCSSCGNCLFACPVYNSDKIEPNAPRGKINIIKGVMNEDLTPNPLNKQLVSKCLVCGSCQAICTNKVEFVPMMLEYRKQIFDHGRLPLIKKFILTMYQTKLFKHMTWAMGLAARTPLSRFLTLPKVKNKRLRKHYARDTQKHYDILLFPGCVLSKFYSHLLVKIKLFLENQGFSVALPKDLQCCGFPFLSTGWQDKFKKFRDANTKVFDKYNFDYLVIPCGSGVSAIKEYYDLQDTKILELTEFLFDFCKDAPITKQILLQNNGKITYHDPCHNLKSHNIKEQPRHFLRQLGDDYVDDTSTYCCGFGGFFSIGFPKTSRQILDRRQQVFEKNNASTVVTSCPGCYMQLKENLPQHVKFFIELFDDPTLNPPPPPKS